MGGRAQGGLFSRLSVTISTIFCYLLLKLLKGDNKGQIQVINGQKVADKRRERPSAGRFWWFHYCHLFLNPGK
jgi:hypothetical protein